MARCLTTLGTLFLFCFYLVTSLFYFRDQIRRSSYFTLLQEQHPHVSPAPVVATPTAAPAARPKAVHVRPSAPVVPVVEGWGAARVLAQQPILLVAAGLPASGELWQFNALRLILEEAIATYGVKAAVQTAVLHGKDKSAPKQQADCRKAKYCVLLAREFEPDLVKEAHAVFTAHRDVRDVLLTLAQRGGCLDTLLQAFTHYAAFAPHACHDMRYEEMVHSGAAREAQRLIGVLGMHVDLMAVVRKIGAWSKAQLAPKQRDALSFVTDDPGAHRLFRTELHKFSTASCANLNATLEQLRSGFGEWLVKERYEAAADERFASNTFVDELASKGVLMGLRTAEHDQTRCPLRSAVPDEALAPMSRAVAQALVQGRNSIATRKRPATGDAAEKERQQTTLSRLGLAAHSALFEAEEAALEQVSAQLGKGVGFSGGGFADFGEAAGGITWVVQVSKDAVYRLVFLYASAAPGGVPFGLHVDAAPRELRFEPTGDAAAVRAREAAVALSRGLHVVRLSAPRRDAARFRLDALVVASDDGEARAALGLPDLNGAAAAAAAAAAATLPGAPPALKPTPGGGRLPGVVLAGMPRAGGAFVLQQLAQQPAFVPHLHLARPAERVHEANHFHMLHAREPLEQYRGLFVRPDGRKQPGDLAGEATSTYSLCAEVPARLHAALPAAKVVLLLRNEVDRAASHYQQCRYKGHNELGSFGETVRREMAAATRCDAQHADKAAAWAKCYLPGSICGNNPWGSACGAVVVGSMYDLVLDMWHAAVPDKNMVVVWSDAVLPQRNHGSAPQTPAALARFQKNMAALAKLIGLQAAKAWTFEPPLPATAEASTASDKYAEALRGDTATLEALQTLYQPHRERLVDRLSAASEIQVVWPTDAGAKDPELRTVSVSRWRSKDGAQV